MIPLQAVNLIIKNTEGKTLLQMRDGTEGINYPLMWGLWGGGMEEEDNANFLQTAAREMQEELDVMCVADDFMLLTDRPQKNGEKGYIVAYKKPLEWGQFKVNEGAGAAFFTKVEIEKLQTSQNIQWILTHKPEIF